jgi:hypothetical protein
VLYVDNDPRVIERGRALLGDTANTAVIQADLRRPDEILNHPETHRLIDFRQPVGLLCVAVTQFIPEAEDPWGLIRRYVDATVSGSYLALSAPTADHQAERVLDVIRDVYAKTPSPAQARTRAEVSRFFDGLEIVPPYAGAAPDVAYVGQWGAEDPEDADDEGARWFYAAVARKP